MLSVSASKSTSPRSLNGVVTGGSIPRRSMFDIFTRPTILGRGLFQSEKLNWDYRCGLIEEANEGCCKAENGCYRSRIHALVKPGQRAELLRITLKSRNRVSWEI